MITLTYTLGEKPDGFSPIQPYLEVRTAYRLPSSVVSMLSTPVYIFLNYSFVIIVRFWG